jgi:hypothetical protein
VRLRGRALILAGLRRKNNRETGFSEAASIFTNFRAAARARFSSSLYNTAEKKSIIFPRFPENG